MMSQSECFICGGRERPTYVSEDGLAVAVPFRDPKFPGHTVVGPAQHHDVADVSDEQWAAIGSVVRQIHTEYANQAGFEKIYLVAIGDADRGHLHFHVLPKHSGDSSLGPFVFGADGWVNRDS